MCVLPPHKLKKQPTPPVSRKLILQRSTVTNLRLCHLPLLGTLGALRLVTACRGLQAALGGMGGEDAAGEGHEPERFTVRAGDRDISGSLPNLTSCQNDHASVALFPAPIYEDCPTCPGGSLRIHA